MCEEKSGVGPNCIYSKLHGVPTNFFFFFFSFLPCFKNGNNNYIYFRQLLHNIFKLSILFLKEPKKKIQKQKPTINISTQILGFVKLIILFLKIKPHPNLVGFVFRI